MSSLQTSDIAIIGSGVAGLAAARVARSAGRTVRILDKGRRIGGRVSTRRADGFTFNHGAQFLTARQDVFMSACADATAAGALRPWQVAGREAFCGTPTMRDFPAFLGAGLAIHQQVEVTGITQEGGFVTLHDSDGPVARAGQLLVTAPAPQTARLLAPVAEDLAATARTAVYAPCWTGMYGFGEDGLSALSTPVSGDSGPVGWACWEAGRPGGAAADTAGSALVVQAAPDWSEAELERDAETIADALLAAFQATIGASLPAPQYSSAHRWRYARVTKVADKTAPRHTPDGVIGVAGDWVSGARVEHAYMSGHHAMTTLIEMASP